MRKELKNSHFIAFIVGLLFLCPAILYANDSLDESDCPVVTPNFDDMSILLTREERIALMDQELKEALGRRQNCKKSINDIGNKKNNSAGASAAANSAGESDGTTAGSDSSENNSAAKQNDTQKLQSGLSDSESAEQKNMGTAAGKSADDQLDTATKQNNAQKSRTAIPSSELSGTELPEQENLGTMAGKSADDQFNNTQQSQPAIPASDLSGTELPEQDNLGTAAGEPADDQLDTATNQDSQVIGSGKLPEDIPSANNDDVVASQIRAAALAESDPQSRAKLWNEYRRYKGMPEK